MIETYVFIELNGKLNYVIFVLIGLKQQLESIFLSVDRRRRSDHRNPHKSRHNRHRHRHRKTVVIVITN